MNPIEDSDKLIETAWSLFEQIPFGRQYLEQLSDLKVRLHQPCELAIAGKVKAGKSSFLNVLIGEDLAKVGDTETTATINRFCYGKPEFPDRPVKVVWDDGNVTYETQDFMNNLQGRDRDVLKVASKIDYLEYHIEHPILRELILVDTPGTGAVVDEHQDVAEMYFNLREKHKQQTRVCTSHADAVVYLMGAVPNIRDKSFLDDFKSSTADGMPLNAVGVLSKVDIDATLLSDRVEQANYLADCLKQQLTTVIPVSAGLFKAIQEKKHLFFEWKKGIQTIPSKTLEMMLKSDKFFFMPNLSNIPVERRREMKNGIPWSVFRTIISTLYHANNVEDAISELLDIANIDEVRHTIDDYFFKRSKLIRCSRVLADLHALCLKIQTLGFFKLREEATKFERWERFAEQYGVHDAKGLAEYLRTQYLSKPEIDNLEYEVAHKLKFEIEKLQQDIQQIDKDFQTLSTIQNNRKLFTDVELDEFNALFGMRKKRLSLDVVMDRLEYWRGEVAFINSTIKRQIINNAIEKYSHL